MAQSNRFVLDISENYTNQKAFIISLDDYFLLSVLNSKLVNFYVKLSFPKLLGETFEFSYKNHMEHLPIAKNFKDSGLEALGKQQTQQNKVFYQQTKIFLSWIESQFNPKKISQKLKKPYKLNEQDFFEELKKQKVKPSLKEFIDAKEGWQELKNIYEQINQTDNEIDEMVFDLYELTQEERKIVLDLL